jgi:imidazolonepropionase-like amidohydrolase
MTSNPAQLFDAPVSGNIAVGEIADLVLWGGDPLELTSEAELVMINGEIIPMESRSLQLRDRYFKRLQP